MKKTKVKAGAAAKAAAKPKGKAATKAATKKGKKGGMDVESNKSKKLAAVTGKSKAQRGAKVANKRGMALTGVASVKDIKATIQREAIKLAKTMVGGNGAKLEDGAKSPSYYCEHANSSIDLRRFHRCRRPSRI